MSIRTLKPSSCVWVGDIPSDWTVEKIKYLIESGENGMKIGPYGSALKGKTIDNGPVKIYNQANLIADDFDISRHYISDETYKELQNYTILPGDILFSMMGTIGKCKVMPDGKQLGIMDSHLLKARLNGKILSEFFLYAFDKDNNEKTLEQLIYMSQGSIMNGLNSSVVKNAQIAVPPLKEQRAIITYLDSKCAAIDEAIERHKKVIEKLEEYRCIQITHMATKGISHESLRKTSSEWYSQIPESWKIMRFKFIGSVKSNLVDPEPYATYHQVGPDLIEKDSGQLIGERTVEEAGVISGNHLFFKGQILYSKVRPALNKVVTAPYDGLCSADMYPIETVIDPNYAKYLMLSKPFVEQARIIAMIRVKMPKINQDELADIVCAVPPDYQQKQISSAITAMCNHVQESISKHNDIIEKLEEYRKSIIYQAVTGKIDCREKA